MWEALQHAGWVTTLATSRWLYGLVSVVHYSAVFFCVGTIVLLDLRILGVADRNNALSALAGVLRPWTWIGFGSVVVSGFMLFAVEAGDFAAAAPFRVKLLAILLAVVCALAIDWSVPKWDRAPVMPVTARLVALVSILLWLGAILASVEVPALTGLG
ncbi:MAG: hypothetical protein DMF87_08680 [Acidobacteria bacterium]|nr:MAG: hypothetical protein DMF88_23920 [Acidobacteriota bacterium]PYR80532.1 MAG: hypothetical protein DMF87_08680 [Acidobacteriota bacterium]